MVELILVWCFFFRGWIGVSISWTLKNWCFVSCAIFGLFSSLETVKNDEYLVMWEKKWGWSHPPFRGMTDMLEQIYNHQKVSTSILCHLKHFWWYLSPIFPEMSKSTIFLPILGRFDPPPILKLTHLYGIVPTWNKPLRAPQMFQRLISTAKIAIISGSL